MTTKVVAIVGGVIITSLFAAGSLHTADAARPNIVLLISDDDDYEHFGFMGSKVAHTPTLDRLAADGTLFTAAHCPAPLCRPSLASILSGRLPHQHGIYANYLENRAIGGDRIKLNPAGSLANQLKSAGYATYATAKYWESDQAQMGFTHGTVETTFKGFGQFVRHGQEELFDFIDDQHAEKPMFVWWAPLLPHGPHNPLPKYANRFADTPIAIPDWYQGDKKRYIAEMRKFYAMGTWFDDGVAQLIQKLKDVGQYENTVFLFYVDNGYTYGQPAKNSPTEKGLRTPMFVTWPGHVPGGKRIDGLHYALDLHATILDYAGLDPAEDIASESLRPVIEGKGDQSREALFGAVYAHAPVNYNGDPSVPRSPQRDVYALYVRTQRWKYVLYTQDLNAGNDRYIWMVHQLCDAFTRRQGEENLYDLEADPYEQNNLADRPEHKQRVAEFHKQVLDWWRQTGGKPLAVASVVASPPPPNIAVVPVAGVDTSTLIGKVMCGYQGWFNCEGDGAGLGWTHWARNGRKPFAPGNVTVDLWPDVSELGPDERYATGFNHSDGRVAKVFSSANRKTVLRHFEWMRDYGIDGAFVQRFASGLANPQSLSRRDTVLLHVRAGANRAARAYAVMYDLTGLAAGEVARVREDWRMLRKTMQITQDAAYLHHQGRPVVAVWGIGFSDDRKYSLAECRELVASLKADGCTVMLGVPSWWREGKRDATDDPLLLEIIKQADIVSPWTVGRYRTPEEAALHGERVWHPDLAWCKRHGLDFLPVVFPGFSWHNLEGDELDAIPRLKGEFLWSQVVAAKRTGCQMIYVAMFDEVDEGTAIFKCTNDPPVGDGVSFLSYDGLPTDHYLRLVGLGGSMLRGELPLSETMPETLANPP